MTIPVGVPSVLGLLVGAHQGRELGLAHVRHLHRQVLQPVLSGGVGKDWRLSSAGFRSETLISSVSSTFLPLLAKGGSGPNLF